MLDMLIRGGRVVTPAGSGDWDVGIVGEKIVSVAFPEQGAGAELLEGEPAAVARQLIEKLQKEARVL